MLFFFCSQTTHRPMSYPLNHWWWKLACTSYEKFLFDENESRRKTKVSHSAWPGISNPIDTESTVLCSRDTLHFGFTLQNDDKSSPGHGTLVGCMLRNESNELGESTEVLPHLSKHNKNSDIRTDVLQLCSRFTTRNTYFRFSLSRLCLTFGILVCAVIWLAECELCIS